MKRLLRVSALVLLVAGIRPIAAFDVPQSRAEFVKAVSDGRGATTTETFTVDQGLDDIYRLLTKKSSACLDVTVKRSGWAGGTYESTSSDYNPTVRRVGAGRVEFALQVIHRPRAIGENAPPGGLYIMAADVRSLGGRRSEVVLYRSKIGFKKIVGSVKEWVAGEDTDCPKMK